MLELLELEPRRLLTAPVLRPALEGHAVQTITETVLVSTPGGAWVFWTGTVTYTSTPANYYPLLTTWGEVVRQFVQNQTWQQLPGEVNQLTYWMDAAEQTAHFAFGYDDPYATSVLQTPTSNPTQATTVAEAQADLRAQFVTVAKDLARVQLIQADIANSNLFTGAVKFAYYNGEMGQLRNDIVNVKLRVADLQVKFPALFHPN